MALASIRGSLKDKGVRLTRQRQILLELIDKSGQHRYRCGDCDMAWTMVDPAV